MTKESIDIYEIRELITAYHQSATQLREFYEKPSYMGLLNVGRKELAHSSFISWLFDSTTFNQSHTDSPIMHLLDIAVKRANQQKKIGENKPISTSLSESIYGRLFSIANSECSIEEAITDKENKKRRSDVVIRCKIKGGERGLNICIENKVLSSEHTSQTYAYSSHYKDGDDNADWLFLFLAPISSVMLNDYSNLKKEDKCESDDFIQINYQDLLEHVLEPLKNSTDKNSQLYFILDDYINTLRYPIMEGNDRKRTIMAMGEKETKLLNDFWEGNHTLIELALAAMSQNTNLDPEVREKAKDAAEGIASLQSARDNTKFVIIESNGKRDNNLGKGYNKIEIAKKFTEALYKTHKNKMRNEDEANKLIIDTIKTNKKKIFNAKHNKKYKMHKIGEDLYLCTNIWGETTDCWRQLRIFLEQENDYFRIECYN